MRYNFVRKIRDREFSWEGDYRQTLKDISKVYRVIGLEKIINLMEKKFGKLGLRDKVEIGSVYLFGTGLESEALCCGLADKPGAFYYGAMGAICYALGLLHHNRMGKRLKTSLPKAQEKRKF